MAGTLKDSPTLKIIACVLGSLVLLTQFARCQQQAELDNFYSDQINQYQNQEQMQQQQMQQMMNEMNGGNGYYPSRSSEPEPQE